MQIIRSLSIILILSIVGLTYPIAAQDGSRLVKLASLTNVVGIIEIVSPDGHWLITRQERGTQLIDIWKNEIVYNITGKILLTPNPQLILIDDIAAESALLMNMDTDRVIAYLPSQVNFLFSPSMNFVASASYRDHWTIITSHTGVKLYTVKGVANSISYDDTYLVLHDVTSNRDFPVIRIFNVQTGEMAARIIADPFPENPQRCAFDSVFVPNTNLLAIHEGHTCLTRIVDTNTWKTLYQVRGGVLFSPDGHFMVSNNGEGFTLAKLHISETGEVIDQVCGLMWFSPTGKYLLKSISEPPDEDSCYPIDMKPIQVIELETMELIFEETGFNATRLVANDTLIEIFSNTTKQTRYIDLASGEVIKTYDASAWLYPDLGWVHLDYYWTNPELPQQLVDFETGEVLLEAERIYVKEGTPYIFVPHDGVIDVYGAPEARIDTMPPPHS